MVTARAGLAWAAAIAPNTPAAPAPTTTNCRGSTAMARTRRDSQTQQSPFPFEHILEKRWTLVGTLSRKPMGLAAQLKNLTRAAALAWM